MCTSVVEVPEQLYTKNVLNIKEVKNITANLVEWDNMHWGKHVDKRISNITFVLHMQQSLQ